MDIDIQIDSNFAQAIEPDLLQRAIFTAIQTVQPELASTGSVAVWVTDNKNVQKLNAQYLGIDAPTDVLSFENQPDPDFPDAEPAAANHVGDIIIAYPVASQQAAARGHTPLEEAALLAVHGALHLLGFDHHTPDHKTEMWATQARVMRQLGLDHVQPTEQ